ncbi:hypothetical protein FRB99_000640 [Tulasnella sp. 403]|nr:hypothetical protein FRB99_000640 [Tulasnella sp. 403]
MSSFEGVHRTSSPKTSTHRGQKPYSRKGTDRAKLRRGQSGFLDGLRNIVSGPLSWLAAIGKDQADSDEENIPGDDAMTGSKRRSTVQKVDGSTPARKRARREASPVTGSQGGPGGYLDPPYVLKDFSSLPNVPSSRQANRGSSVGRGDVLVRNAIEPEPSPLLGLGTEERRPHRQIASNGHTSAFDVGSTDVGHATFISGSLINLLCKYANSSDGRLRQSSSFLNGSPNSSTLPRHKTPTGGLQDSPRKQSNVIRFDYSPKAVGSSSTTATPRSALGSRPLGDGVVRSQSRTPSLHDLTTDRPRVSSPERDRTQGPLRMGSALRQSHTPMDLQNRLSPTKLSRSSGGAGGSLFGPPVTNPLVRRSSSIMALDSSGLSPLGRRQSSQMIFEPSLGITTAEEAAAAAAASATSSPAKPRPPRNNAERILLALEQSTPLTDARKLRLKQKEAIRPPKPLRSLDSRTNRMLNPYGRPTLDKANSKQQNEDPSLPSERTPGALRRYLDAGRKAKGVQKSNDVKSTMDVVVEEVDDDKQMDTTDEQTTGREGAASSKQDKSVEAMPEESAEKVRSTSMPGRPTSSLRSGRAPAYRTHVPSSRPTNRFSAKFLDDDDGDAMDNDTASLSPAELSKWAEKGTGALEVPAGFSFDFGAKAAESKALADLKEKEKRDALLARLRGDVPAAVSFATPDGKAALPAVPSLPFKFGGVTLAAPKKETPKAETPAPPVTKAVEPQVPPKTSEPKYPAELSVRPPVAPAATSLPFSFATTDTTRSLFAPSAPAVAAQPSVDTTPKATNAPVPALPFSFGSSSTPAAKPTSSFSFSFGGGGSFTPSPFAVSSLAPAAKATDTIPEAKDATPSSTSTKSPFSFGSTAPSQSIFGAPSTAPTTSSGSQSLTPAAEPIRSTAPSPSPFATLGKEKLWRSSHQAAPKEDRFYGCSARYFFWN